MEPLVICVVGAILGLRFNVLALVHAILIAGIVYGMANIMSGLSVFAEFGYFAILAVAAQAGYFVGVLGRDLPGAWLHRLARGEINRV